MGLDDIVDKAKDAAADAADKVKDVAGDTAHAVKEKAADVKDAAHDALVGRQTQGGAPTGSPGASQLFDFNSYEGGAVVLHALRMPIGDDAFFELLRRWAADNSGTSRSSLDFIALAEEVSGRSLDDFFDTWLYAANVPAAYPEPVASQ